MRIAYMIGRADTIGGSQKHVLDLASACERLGDDVVVFTGPAGPFTAALRDAGVATIALEDARPERLISPLADVRTLKILSEELRRFRPDVLTVHGTKFGCLGRVLGKIAGVPVIYTLHGVSFGANAPAIRARLALAMERSLAGWTSHFIAVSEADYIEAKTAGVLEGAPAKVIRNGVMDRTSSPVRGSGRDSTRFLMIARLAAQKDHALLLRTLSEMVDGPAWSLDLVGDGELEADLRSMVSELGLGDRVRFLGLVDSTDEVIDGADVSVLITHYEGLPLAIVESLRDGRPVVATAVGGIPEVVRNEVEGWLVPPSDQPALRAALEIASDPATDLRSIGHAARVRYVRDLSWESFFASTRDVYRTVVES